MCGLPQDTASIFNIFLATLGKTSFRKGNPTSESQPLARSTLGLITQNQFKCLSLLTKSALYLAVMALGSLPFHRVLVTLDNYQRLYITLACLIHASFTSGIFPDKLKLARITVIFKKDSRFDKDS